MHLYEYMSGKVFAKISLFHKSNKKLIETGRDIAMERDYKGYRVICNLYGIAAEDAFAMYRYLLYYIVISDNTFASGL